MTFEVVEPGPLTLVQDAGRPGLSALGVGPSGAFDRRALRQSRELLGNDPLAAALETLGGLRLRARERHVVAVTGGMGRIEVDGQEVAHGRAVVVEAGSVLTVAPPSIGLRAYVGIAGGVRAPEVLGSRARDTLAALGPEPLAAGDVVEVGPAGRTAEIEDVPSLLTAGSVTVAAVPGPRDDWFAPTALARLFDTGWTVSGRSDRIGVRLDGPPLDRVRTDELASEPVIRGSIQVTSAGLPVVLGPDHPVTGGYPVIAVVADADTDRLAQARPGDVVRFTRRRA